LDDEDINNVKYRRGKDRKRTPGSAEIKGGAAAAAAAVPRGRGSSSSSRGVRRHVGAILFKELP